MQIKNPFHLWLERLKPRFLLGRFSRIGGKKVKYRRLQEKRLKVGQLNVQCILREFHVIDQRKVKHHCKVEGGR